MPARSCRNRKPTHRTGSVLSFAVSSHALARQELPPLKVRKPARDYGALLDCLVFCIHNGLLHRSTVLHLSPDPLCASCKHTGTPRCFILSSTKLPEITVRCWA